MSDMLSPSRMVSGPTPLHHLRPPDFFCFFQPSQAKVKECSPTYGGERRAVAMLLLRRRNLTYARRLINTTSLRASIYGLYMGLYYCISSKLRLNIIFDF